MTAIAPPGIGGGSLGILLGKPTLSRMTLASGGLFVTLGLIVVLWWQQRYILTLIEQISGGEMTTLEIVATGIGLVILVTLGVGFWGLLRH